MRTAREIKMKWQPSGGRWTYDLTIPKGTKVAPASHGEYFIDDLDWIPGRGNGLLLHDATHYGIRIKAEDVV